MGLFSAIRTAILGPDRSATFPGQTDEGDRAWREFQERIARERAEAVNKHARRREIDARQRAVVNAALEAGKR